MSLSQFWILQLCILIRPHNMCMHKAEVYFTDIKGRSWCRGIFFFRWQELFGWSTSYNNVTFINIMFAYFLCMWENESCIFFLCIPFRCCSILCGAMSFRVIARWFVCLLWLRRYAVKQPELTRMNIINFINFKDLFKKKKNLISNKFKKYDKPNMSLITTLRISIECRQNLRLSAFMYYFRFSVLVL